jgi:hypothetical protein
MKITNYLLLSLIFLLLNCSASNGEESLDNTAVAVKDLTKMTGDDDHWLNYENGKITKAWDNSHTYRSQLVYNSNGMVSKDAC